MIACHRCGYAKAEAAKFCSECGAAPGGAPTDSGATRQERKVVTVLFADIVGFTSRAERLDPEDVHALLAPYHARVKGELERFGGTVEKFIGDAVMALFGASIAHEDDPERAVRAALAIRDWAEAEKDLQVRIGVTTGEALVSLGARPEAGEGVASGDVVNTAARLQVAAPVNAILVDVTTYRATNRVIGYVDAEAVQAKGKVQPIPVWRPIEALSRLGVDVRQHGGAPLVGRGRELQLLVGALERVKERREPELVTLVGVPGIGKSRLVYELLQHVDREPDLVTWRQGRSLPYGDGVTFWALGEMVKAQAGILETDGASEAGTKLAHTARSLIDDAAEAERVARHLRPLVGIGGDAELARDRNEVFTAWRRFLEALAAVRPLVLVFEDLHWADESLLDFVDHLVDWAIGAPMLVVATARPELLSRRPGWGGGKANSTTLSLHALTEAETAALVRSLLDRAVAPTDVQAEVLSRAGGNPLYAEEFARMIAERVGRAAGAAEELVPESVQGIIAARLDALPRAEKSLIQAASVMGKVFWQAAVAKIGGIASGELDERLHALERKEFIRREARSSVSRESEYAFRHVLVRDVAYGQIPRASRAEKHRLAAEWLESLGEERADDRADMLAHHYLSAMELAEASGQQSGELSQRARAALRDAGDRALSLHAATTAAAFYERAIDLLLADDPQRPDMLFRRGRAKYVAYDEDAIAAVEEARDALIEAGDTSRAAHAEQMVSRLWWYRGRTDIAREHMDRALALLGEDRSSEAAVRVVAYAARLYELADEHSEALRLASEAEPAAEALGLDVMRANIATTMGMARIDVGDVRGLADLERGVEIALAAGELGEAGIASQNFAGSLYSSGQTIRGWELAHQAMDLDRRAGATAMSGFQEAVLCQEGYDTGAWDEAVADWDRIIANGQAPTMQPSLHCKRALVGVARGDTDAAIEDVNAALALAEHRIESRADVLATAARIYAELGALDRARETATDFALSPQADIEASRYLAVVAGELGQSEGLRRILGRFEASSSFASAILAAADGAFVAAADLFVEMRLLPEEADSRLRAGRRLIAEGRPDEAAEQLRRAIEFYRSVRATRYLAQAEELLAQTGAAAGAEGAAEPA